MGPHPNTNATFCCFLHFSVLVHNRSRMVREAPRSIPNPMHKYFYLERIKTCMKYIYIYMYTNIYIYISATVPSGIQCVFDSMQNLQASEQEGGRRFSSFKGKAGPRWFYSFFLALPFSSFVSTLFVHLHFNAPLPQNTPQMDVRKK